jgi:hypothetical protein
LTIQDFGSIGELVAAIAIIATIAYLAIQVGQNTRAIRSSTFHGISEQMAQNVLPILTRSVGADILARDFDDPGGLSPAERLRFQSVLVMSVRRTESIHVQIKFEAIVADLTEGFERSLLSLLHSSGGGEWWASAKVTFTREFVDHVDSCLAENDSAEHHPSIGVSLRQGTTQQDGDL